MPDAVEWSYDPADAPSRALVAYAAIGLFGGFLLLVFGAGLLFVGRAVQAGNYSLLVLVGILALVGGPMSLLYLWPMLTDPEQRPPVYETTWRPERHLLIVAILLGAVVDVAVLALTAYWFPALFLLAVPVFVLLSQMNADGRLDPDADTIELYTRTATLSQIEAYRSVSLGPVALFWLTYATRSQRGPRVLSVPRRVAPDVKAALRWAVDQPVDVDTSPGPGRLPMLVAAACCLLAAVGVGLVGHFYANSAALLAPGIGLFAVLGLLFAWLAMD